MTKILLLAANPKDNSQLRLDIEIREIEQAISHARFGDQFQFDPKRAVRLKDLLEYLEKVKPDIVHFSGHGSASSEIVLVDEQGNSYLVQKETMQRIFSLLKGKTKCVVLNACYTEPLAKVIAENMNCIVVGMSGTISDTDATEFASGFYKQLANGKDVNTAFQLASTHVSSDIARSTSLYLPYRGPVFVKKGLQKYAFPAVSAVVLIIALIMAWALNPSSSPSLPQTIASTPTPTDAITNTVNNESQPVVSPPIGANPVEIVIGVGIALGGKNYAIGQEQQKGISIAEDYFEKKYEGYEINIIWENAGAEAGKTDLEMANQAFNNLVSTDVIAILGPTLSAQALVVDHIAQDRGIPVVAISNTHPRIVTDIGDYIFRISAGVEKYAPKILGKIGAQVGAKTAMLLYLNEEDSFTIPECEEGFRPSLGSNGMTPIDKDIPYTSIVANDESARNLVIDSVYANEPVPELVIICGLTDDGVSLIKGLRDRGYSGVIVGGNGLSTPSLLSKCDERCEGVYLAQAYNYSSQSSLNITFKDAYGSEFPTQFAAQAFTGVQVIVESIYNMSQNIGEISLSEKRDALKKYLLEADHRYNTLLGNLRFDKDGDINQENFTIVKVSNNKFEIQ